MQGEERMDAGIQVRQIPGYPEYAATNDGRIIKVKKNGLKFITIRDNGTGYRIAAVKDANGKSRYRKVHRLMALAFIGPQPSPKHEVCHINGKRDDNRIENLKWDTRKNNILDRKKYNPGYERYDKLKLNEDMAREIKNKLAAGQTGLSIAQEYGISTFHVSNIKNGRVWINA
jgi:hypothetical protein